MYPNERIVGGCWLVRSRARQVPFARLEVGAAHKITPLAARGRVRSTNSHRMKAARQKGEGRKEHKIEQSNDRAKLSDIG
jgi:hypothetical protein